MVGQSVSSDYIIYFKGASFSVFNNNSGGYGGAIYTQGGFLAFIEVSATEFNNNTATKNNGGAIYSTKVTCMLKQTPL